MIYLLLIPLAFLAVIVFRAVVAPSPHVRIAPLQEGSVPTLSLPESGEEAPALAEAKEEETYAAMLPSREEKETLLVCAARYAPDAFESFIEVSYPTLCAMAKTRVVGKSLYLELDVETDLLPVVCAVQMDVPDAAVTPDTKNPFFFAGGQFDGQYRAIAMLDALENVLKQGGKLKRGLKLVFLHNDEDIPTVLEDLQSQSEAYACVLCEGGHIARFGRNEKNRIAAVGVGVRTNARFRMQSASQNEAGAGGDSALHMLAQAVLYLEDPPFRAKLDTASRAFLKSALYENGFFSRLVAMNPRIFAPIALKVLQKHGGANAARSCAVVSNLHAERNNGEILESHADIDCILAPHESVIRFEKKLRRRIGDNRIALELMETDEPHIYADPTSFGYKAVQKAIALSIPNTNAAPAVMIEAPLAKALRPLCACTLAFSPYGDDIGANAQCAFFENFFLQLC